MCAMFCVGETIVILLATVYAAQDFDRLKMGTAMGAFDAAMALSLPAGPVISVTIYKSTGQMSDAFLAVAAPAVLAFFAAVTWLHEHGSRHSTSTREG